MLDDYLDGKAHRLVITTIEIDGILIKGEIDMAELREGQRMPVTAAPKTRSGNPAAYDEEAGVTWESSDPSIATVTPDETDPLKAVVEGVDGSSNGSVVVSFKADGDPDADQERQLIGTLDVTVTQGEAVVFELEAGEPEDVPFDNGEGEPEPAPPIEEGAEPAPIEEPEA